MGMDGVEIVMKVEEAFDIQIEDSEAAKLLIPRQLIDLVEAKVANVETTVCLTHRAFNLLRRQLVQSQGMLRDQITPSTNLNNLLPASCRKSFIGSLAGAIATDAPKLVRPLWTRVIIATVALAAAAYVTFTLNNSFDVRCVLGAAAAVLTLVVTVPVTKPFRTNFPKHLATAGDLARWIRSHKPDLADKSQKAWTREQIAARVREIVIEVLACERHYSEDGRFVEDLGLS